MESPALPVTKSYVEKKGPFIGVAVRLVIAAIVILLALATGVAGALYPAAYSMRIRAVEALRFE